MISFNFVGALGLAELSFACTVDSHLVIAPTKRGQFADIAVLDVHHVFLDWVSLQFFFCKQAVFVLFKRRKLNRASSALAVVLFLCYDHFWLVALLFVGFTSCTACDNDARFAIVVLPPVLRTFCAFALKNKGGIAWHVVVTV